MSPSLHVPVSHPSLPVSCGVWLAALHGHPACFQACTVGAPPPMDSPSDSFPAAVPFTDPAQLSTEQGVQVWSESVQFQSELKSKVAACLRSGGTAQFSLFPKRLVPHGKTLQRRQVLWLPEVLTQTSSAEPGWCEQCCPHFTDKQAKALRGTESCESGSQSEAELG